MVIFFVTALPLPSPPLPSEAGLSLFKDLTCSTDFSDPRFEKKSRLGPVLYFHLSFYLESKFLGFHRLFGF